MTVSVRLLLPSDVPLLFDGADDAGRFDLSGRREPEGPSDDEGRSSSRPEERRALFAARWQSLLFKDTVWPATVVAHGQVAGWVVCAVLGDRLWLTGSLLPRFRGKGLLFDALTSALAVMTVRPVHVRLPAGAPTRLVTVFSRLGFRRVEVTGPPTGTVTGMGAGVGVGVGSRIEEIHRLDFGSD